MKVEDYMEFRSGNAYRTRDRQYVMLLSTGGWWNHRPLLGRVGDATTLTDWRDDGTYYGQCEEHPLDLVEEVNHES